MSNLAIIIQSVVGGVVAGGILVGFSYENSAFLPVWAKILVHALLIGVMVFEFLHPFSKKNDEYFVTNRERIKKATIIGSFSAFGCSAGVLYLLYDQTGLSVWTKAIMLGILIGFYLCQMLTMFANADVKENQIAESLLEKKEKPSDVK